MNPIDALLEEGKFLYIAAPMVRYSKYLILIDFNLSSNFILTFLGFLFDFYAESMLIIVDFVKKINSHLLISC